MEQKLARMEANYKAEIEALKAVRQWLLVGCWHGAEWWSMRCCMQSGLQLVAKLPAQCAASAPLLTLIHPSCPTHSQGGATAGAAAVATAEAVRQKETKINELIEELGNKELLLSEAQSQLAAVSREERLPVGLPGGACGAAGSVQHA